AAPSAPPGALRTVARASTASSRWGPTPTTPRTSCWSGREPVPDGSHNGHVGTAGIVRPYGDTTGDGMVQLSFTLPVPPGPRADGAAQQLAHRMGIDP